MKSMPLTERQKRCLTRAWSRRSPRLENKFGNRHVYLKHRVRELEERVKKTAGHIRRLRGCLLGGVGELLLDEDKDDRDLGGEEDAKDGPGESLAQTNRLYTQTVLVLDVFEEERVRDLLILEHSMVAFKALASTRDPNCSAAGAEAADKVAHDAMEEASVVRLNNSLVLIAGRAAETSEGKLSAETLLEAATSAARRLLQA